MNLRLFVLVKAMNFKNSLLFLLLPGWFFFPSHLLGLEMWMTPTFSPLTCIPLFAPADFIQSHDFKFLC